MKEGNRLLRGLHHSAGDSVAVSVDSHFGVRGEALLALNACLTRGNEIRRLAYGVEHRVMVDRGIDAKIMLSVGR